MKTSDIQYTKILKSKYLPGRSIYLKTFVYPRIIKRLKVGSVIDMGCGFGDFLQYIKKYSKQTLGLDSNVNHVKICIDKNLEAKVGNILTYSSDHKFNNAILDNVLEHLDLNEIEVFFSNIRNVVCSGGRIIIIVPCLKGQQNDPTHKTYITREILSSFCDSHDIRLIEIINLPTPFDFVGKYFYLQMKMFVLDIT